MIFAPWLKARTNPAHPLQGPDRVGYKQCKEERSSTRLEPSVLFDLDGTLVESVYQHVFPGGLRLMREDRALVWRNHPRSA